MILRLAPLCVCISVLCSRPAYAVGTWQVGPSYPATFEGRSWCPYCPASMALLTDGRVLISGTDTSKQWWIFTPSVTNSYLGGYWSASPIFSHIGRFDNPSFVLRDATYVACGGEVTDPPANTLPEPVCEYDATSSCGTCESFDPVANQWNTMPSMPENRLSWNSCGDRCAGMTGSAIC